MRPPPGGASTGSRSLQTSTTGCSGTRISGAPRACPGTTTAGTGIGACWREWAGWLSSPWGRRARVRSGGLPQLDPVVLRIGDPAEPADTLHVLRLFGHVRSLGAQLREHRIQIADPEVEHGL